MAVLKGCRKEAEQKDVLFDSYGHLVEISTALTGYQNEEIKGYVVLSLLA